MKVSADVPSAMFPSSRAMASPSQQINGGHRSFAQLLRGPNGSRGTDIKLPKLTVDAGAKYFAIETKIGEDAVRFDARPIVAPTGDAKSAAGAGANHSTVTKAAATEAPAQAELEKLVEQLAQYLPTLTEHFTKEYDPAQTATDPATPLRAAPAVGTGVESLPLQGSRVPRLPTAKPAEAMTAKPATVPPLAHTSSALARVTALPREIVIVLHGVALSAKERETLTDIMQRELSPLRLGGKTIRIIGAGGKV